MKIKELNRFLKSVMPLELAFDWDNIGLLIGDGEEDLTKVLLTLDVTSAAVDKAIKEKCNLILSHHPLIFGKINKINNPLYLKLIRARIDVISMHTNLDSIPTGVNKVLAERLGLTKLRFISSECGNSVYWGKVFVPAAYYQILVEAISKAGAGIYPNYTNCFVNHEVKGSFIPGELANPTIGESGREEVVEELELQFRVDKANLQRVTSAIILNHPYETPVYNFTEIIDDNINYGSGMVGELAAELDLKEFAQLVKTNLQAPFVKVWNAGKSETKIKRVAVCGGSGSFLIQLAMAKSDVIVTGDVTYHTMLDSTLPIIDAGHFYTENPVLDYLEELLTSQQIESVKLLASEHEIKNLTIL